MENWAYIYILSEETEQKIYATAGVEPHGSGNMVGAGDRASHRGALPQAVKSSCCGQEGDHEIETDSYPSYFFL